MRSDLAKLSKKLATNRQYLVLIVDDDQDNLLLASYIVESLGMSPVATDDSEKCLSLVNKLLPDLILLDIVMPKLNGLQISYLIKQNKKTSHIPIMAITGLTRQKDIKEIIQAGCDDYLTKPYLIEDLQSKLYYYLKFNFN